MQQLLESRELRLVPSDQKHKLFWYEPFDVITLRDSYCCARTRPSKVPCENQFLRTTVLALRRLFVGPSRAGPDIASNTPVDGIARSRNDVAHDGSLPVRARRWCNNKYAGAPIGILLAMARQKQMIS